MDDADADLAAAFDLRAVNCNVEHYEFHVGTHPDTLASEVILILHTTDGQDLVVALDPLAAVGLAVTVVDCAEQALDLP
ncbi:MAG: hypothetical protein U5K29_00670 [Acidimicrobiales bacterium]|nr:hypothetical protein [Acidimicrobiales bacterium]